MMLLFVSVGKCLQNENKLLNVNAVNQLHKKVQSLQSCQLQWDKQFILIGFF